MSKPINPDELRDVLAAAIRAGRSRVLVVGREEQRAILEPGLDELGIEHQWEITGAAAARVCGERRFELSLIDVGIRNPQAALQALDLRGRRLRRDVILFSDDETPDPLGYRQTGNGGRAGGGCRPGTARSPARRHGHRAGALQRR